MYDTRTKDGETKTTFTELVTMLDLKVSIKVGEGPGGLDGIVAGFPDYALHKWAARLTQQGWTVVIIDQVKNGIGKVTNRKVTRILTPGSHIEAAATSSDLYLTFVTIKGTIQEAPILAVTALDLTTGHLHVFETKAQGSDEAWTCNDLVQFMELYPPKEVLWSMEGPKYFCESITEGKLKQILACSQTTTFHQRAPLNSGAWTKPSIREQYLTERCGLKTLLPTHVALHVAPGSHTETALISLLNALEELWPSMTLGSLLVYPWVPGSFMRLGENALVQLHMITDSAKQDVLSIFDRSATPMGRRGIRERLLKPSAEAAVISEHLDAVGKWQAKDATYTGQVVKRLKTMSDLHRLYRRIQQGSVNSTDIMGLDTTLKAAEWLLIQESIPREHVQVVQEATLKIFSLEKSYEGSEDKSLFVPGLVPSLDELEAKIRGQHQRITEFVTTCTRAAGVAGDVFKADFREKSLVIKGPRGAIQTLKISGKLPDRAVAVTNKTNSYIESPELDQIYVILSKYREALKKEQAVALVEHGTALANEVLVHWMLTADWITTVDVNLTLARVATDMGYVRPTILDDPLVTHGSVVIEGLRHPLLEAQDRKIPYVQHSVSIGANDAKGWLLYGLNASGKSSLMRATGLAVLLAQGGSFVPASKMVLAPFNSLHTRIINTDNLWMGLSSFAVEMSEMRDIFRDAGPRSLVLGDELCSGTETTSATALVAAGLKGLIKRGARFLFATHLHGLGQIPEVVGDKRLSIWHLHVEYDRLKDRLVYHRTLKPGSGSSLYGLEVAKAMRLPDDILEDAIQFRKRLAGQAELSESVGSSWNSAVVRRKCEHCGTTEADSLEVHHIKERRFANAAGRLVDGSDVHAVANLVVLCDGCHDKIHANELIIGPLVQTSDGLERSTVVSELAKEGRKSKWSEEQLRTIESVYRQYPTLKFGALSNMLLNKYEIEITAVTLKKMLT